MCDNLWHFVTFVWQFVICLMKSKSKDIFAQSLMQIRVSSVVPWRILSSLVDKFETHLTLTPERQPQDGKRGKLTHGDGDELRRRGDQEVGQKVQEVGHRQLGLTLSRWVHDIARAAAEPPGATGHRYLRWGLKIIYTTIPKKKLDRFYKIRHFCHYFKNGLAFLLKSWN